MNPKTTIGLVIALLIAVGAIWWLRAEEAKPETPKETGPTKLIAPPLGELASFEIQSGNAPAIVLNRADGHWSLQQPVAGAAEEMAVNGDVNKLKDLEFSESFAKGTADYPTPQMTSLASPRCVAKLTDDKGTTVVLRIGARQSLSNKTYVQKAGDETVYLVEGDLNKELKADLSAYRSQRVVEFPVDDVTRVSVSGEQQFVLAKGDKDWTVESPMRGRADASKVTAMLRALANLRASEFVTDAPPSLRPYGLESPRMVVEVTTVRHEPAEGAPENAEDPPAEPTTKEVRETLRLQIGGTADDKVFARIDDPDRPSVFQFPSASVARIAPALTELRDARITTVDPMKASRLAVRTPDGAVEVAQENGTWKIVSGAGGNAEFAAIAEFLKTVQGLKAVGFDTGDTLDLGFDAPRCAMEITVEGQVEPLKLTLGKMTPSRTGAYLRNDGEGFAAVISAEDAEKLSINPGSFLSRTMLTFDGGGLTRMAVSQESRDVTLDQVGGVWSMTQPIAAAADRSAVSNVVRDLSNLRGRRVVGLADAMAEYGLDRPSVRVTVTVEPPVAESTESPPATELQTHTLLVSEHAGQVYGMLEGGATVCELDARVLNDLQAEFLDPTVLSVDVANVVRVGFRGETSFAFEKTADGWAMADEPTFKTDKVKVNELLNAVAALKATRCAVYADAALSDFGLASPAMTLSLGQDGGASVELMISASGPAGGGRYVMQSAAPGRVYVISQESADKLLKQATDFRVGGVS